jgi:hypothetical protein
VAETVQDYFTVEQSAARLGLTPVALRHRIRRTQRKEGKEVVARIGAGIVAYRIGSSWRVRFPPPEVP